MSALEKTTTGEITEAQHQKLLKLVRDDPNMGTVRAAREAGIPGTKGELRALLEPFAEEIREARGRKIEQVEQVCWQVAVNPEHPAWDRANARLLKAYVPAFRDSAHLTMSGPDGGPMEVTNPDVAAAIERFTSTVVRLAERSRPELPAGDARG